MRERVPARELGRTGTLDSSPDGVGGRVEELDVVDMCEESRDEGRSNACVCLIGAVLLIIGDGIIGRLGNDPVLVDAIVWSRCVLPSSRNRSRRVFPRFVCDVGLSSSCSNESRSWTCTQLSFGLPLIIVRSASCSCCCNAMTVRFDEDEAVETIRLPRCDRLNWLAMACTPCCAICEKLDLREITRAFGST